MNLETCLQMLSVGGYIQKGVMAGVNSISNSLIKYIYIIKTQLLDVCLFVCVCVCVCVCVFVCPDCIKEMEE